jgi:alanine dehydrogenase
MRLLTRGEVAGLLTCSDYFGAAETAFRLLGVGRAELPAPLRLTGLGGAFHAKAAMLPLSRPYAAIKVNGNFPANPERFALPTIQGAILLLDAETGYPLALLDSVEITLGRTAAASAVAARSLARPYARVVTICGCGAQAGPQLEHVAAVLPLERAFAWDRVFERAEFFAAQMTERLGFEVRATADLPAATLQSDVILTCTTARRPFLGLAHVAPGTFIAAVGADDPEKQELEPALLVAASLYADLADQCEAMGELHHAVAAGLMRREDIAGEIADVVLGRKAGRRCAEEIIVFDSTGTAVQDVAAAALAYERAEQRGVGREVALA